MHRTTAGRCLEYARERDFLQDLKSGEHTITFARAGFATLERKIDALTTYVATINAVLMRRSADAT